MVMESTEALKEKKVETTEPRYYLASQNGVPEKLTLDTRFTKKLSRGAMGNPNMFMSSEQKEWARQYAPTAKWSKDERIVFNLMQNLIDKTGQIPTVGQISQVSEGKSYSKGSSVMERHLSAEEVIPTKGLSVDRVQKALRKLQKRGIVLEV